jgi:Tn3 transposase DDE domain
MGERVRGIDARPQYPRQNALAKALREIGRLERTLFTLGWISDPLCVGEPMPASTRAKRATPSRAVFFHRLGSSQLSAMMRRSIVPPTTGARFRLMRRLCGAFSASLCFCGRDVLHNGENCRRVDGPRVTFVVAQDHVEGEGCDAQTCLADRCGVWVLSRLGMGKTPHTRRYRRKKDLLGNDYKSV